MYFRQPPKMLNPPRRPYERLLNAKLYSSDTISDETRLVLDGTTLAARGTMGRLHVKENQDQLDIYLPNNKQERKRCKLRDLPAKLLDIFQLPSQGPALKLFADILTQDIEDLPVVLTDAGIMPLKGFVAGNLPELVDPQATSGESEEVESDQSSGEGINAEDTATEQSSPPSLSVSQASFHDALDESPAVQGDVALPPSMDQSGAIRPHDRYALDVLQMTQRFARLSAGSGVGTADLSSAPERAYINLLERLSAAAMVMNSNASDVWFTVTNVSNNLDNFDTRSSGLFGERSRNQFAHDANIGAAGELLVSGRLVF